MGMIEFSKGFFVFDKSWIHENEFCQSLSHAEFRVLIYLLSSGLKISQRDQKYKRGDLIASLYRTSKILFVNVSQPTIAEKCPVDRATAYKALKKFRDFGAVIRVPDVKDNGDNDLYIIGFQNNRKEKAGKQEYYLVDSIPIRTGQKLTDRHKKFIETHYKDELFGCSDMIWSDLFGMGNDSKQKDETC